MTITEFSIKFDQPLYYPGQMITGNVTVALDKPKDINGIELKIKGRTKFEWSESESYTDSEGKTQSRTVSRKGKERYLETEIKLVRGKTELIIGVHNYPFAVMLPVNSPSSFKGKYGGIAYFAKVKIDIPMGFDKDLKNHFQVENPLDLNHFPNFKNSAKEEKSKTFCCLCCASGPLTMVVLLPKTGFAKTESIPITVEIDNASNVKVDSVKAHLTRKIHWRADGDSKDEKNVLKKLSFGAVEENSSKTYSENMPLDCGPFPNISSCGIIKISYKLDVEADPSGVHDDLEIEIPVTIGDIPFFDGVNVDPNASYAPGAPASSLPMNPAAPGSYMPPNTGFSYPNVPETQISNPNVGFNQAAPYPPAPGGMNPVPYPSGPGGANPAPYPPSPGVYNPSDPAANSQGPYPPASGVGYPGSYPPVAEGNSQGPYPPASGGNPQVPYLPVGHPSYAPASAQYPSTPYPPPGMQPYQNEPEGYNPVPVGGNAVAYPYAANNPNNVPSDPAAAPTSSNIQLRTLNAPSDPNDLNLKSGSIVGESSIEMPTSNFLGAESQNGVKKEANASIPSLPPASSPPFN